MRTTLDLNDDLVELAKKKAAERKSSLSAVVNEALRASFKQPASEEAAPPFRMLTFAPQKAPHEAAVDTSPRDLLLWLSL
ncbi:MAG: CopG family transcriptional regulator [Kiritimatiellia bacterium]